MTENNPLTVTSLFLRSTTKRFLKEYLPRLEQAVTALPAADLWWRPHPNTNSVGNLLLHLEGNVRQWIISGIGGVPDHRERASEFGATHGAGARELLAKLRATVEEACQVIESLDGERLKTSYLIQGYQVTVLEGVYHVLEHFSWHAGQITWIAKERAGEDHDIAFYNDATLNRARNE